MTTEKKFDYLEVEAALCVWEWINDVTLGLGGHNTSPEWIKLREEIGSGELRHQSIALGQWCLAVYDICVKHDPEFFDGIAYDWEVIPMIMAHARDDDGTPVIHPEGGRLQPPQHVAMFVAREHLFDEFERSCIHEAHRQWAYGDLPLDHEERTESAFVSGDEPAAFIKWLGEKYDLINFKGSHA